MTTRCGIRRGFTWIAVAFVVAGLTFASSALAAQLTLTWTDNATDELGFRVERRLNPGSYSEITTVGANVTSYADTTVTAGLTYCYQVRAYNSAGNSGYSNEACGTASIPPSVTLTVTKVGTGTGTVSSTAPSASPALINCGSDCTETVPNGTVIALAAVPTAGSTFTGWSGGGCAGTGGCSVTVAAATTVTATFAPANYLLTASKAGTGSGTVTGTQGTTTVITCGSDCTETVPNGTVIALAAGPAAGSTFTGWSGGGCTGTGGCAVTVAAATTVTATFASVPTRTLTVATSGTGSVTSPGAISCPGDCTHTAPSGTQVILAAAPGAGFTFTGWSGGGCSGTGACTVTLTQNTTVTATFAPATYSLTVSKGGSGTGTVSGPGISCGTDCSQSVAGGTAVTLTASADNGSTFTGWSGACGGTGSCSVTVSANTVVSATFDVEGGGSTPYTQRLVAGGGAYTDAGGNLWSADRAYSPGSWGHVGGNTYRTTDPIGNTQDDPLYQSERYGNFSYRFDVPDGRYDVTLHFAETYFAAPAGQRRFDVYIEGVLVLDNYDIYAVAGHHVAVAVTFSDILVTDGQLTIDFVTITGNATVSAIDISSSHIQTPYTQRLVAGGGAYTDAGGNLWSADRAYSPGSWGHVGGNTYRTTDPIGNTQDDPLYQSERYGNFSYRFDVPDGRYDVTLHFAETYFAAPAGQRRFDVYIEGVLVLDNYDIYAVAGHHVAVAVTFSDILVTDGQLTIDFVTITGNATVSAIDISSSHIQTPYTQRLVAGGGAYTDAGGNLWSADRAYSPGSWGHVGGNTYRTTDPIGNTQDDPLYQSERYGNFSYRFDVPDGRYDVTLHFAETYFAAPAGQRRFDVYIEGVLVLDNYDIYAVAGHHVAVAVTFSDILVTDGQLTIDFVTITGNATVSAIDIRAAGSP